MERRETGQNRERGETNVLKSRNKHAIGGPPSPHHCERTAFRSVLISVLATIVLVTTSVAATLPLQVDARIPAAQGQVKLRHTKNGNTEIALSVKHLAAPEKIDPTSSVFVVWVRGLEAGALPQSLGAMRVTKNLTGRLKSVTTLREFDLFVTCEGTQTVTAPTGPELLTLHYSGK